MGYAGTYVTDRASHLSVLPVGYADGIPRERSPQAGVEICGRRFPVVGQVSMDQIVIDTGAECFPVGASTTVFGPDGGATPTIQDWARWAGTIPHTIVTGIGPHIHEERRVTRRIVVIGGGENAEHDVSLATARRGRRGAAFHRMRRRRADHRPRGRVEARRAGCARVAGHRFPEGGAERHRTRRRRLPRPPRRVRRGRDLRGVVHPHAHADGRLGPARRGAGHGQVGDQARGGGRRDPHCSRPAGGGRRCRRHRVRDGRGREAGLGRVELRCRPRARRLAARQHAARRGAIRPPDPDRARRDGPGDRCGRPA